MRHHSSPKRHGWPAVFVGSLILSLLLSTAAAAQQRQITALRSRVIAPSLDSGGEWLNTSEPLSLADLRGKFVVLDFWTYCCINCMHVLPELKKFEQAYPNEVVVIGVHSAKFETEKEAENIRKAVLRHDIEHPVVNDARLVLWKKYGVDMWPSLRIIDPEGYVIAVHRGEFDFEMLDRYFRRMIPLYRRRGLNDKPLRFDLERDKAAATPLRFPGKVLADEAANRLFIADTSHNRIVVATLEGRLLDVIGTGEMGSRDGGYAEATFDHPQGMALHGDVLFVADTENHLIRAVDLKTRQVSTVAGNGERAWQPPAFRSHARPRSVSLASPWDVLAEGDHLYIAMAGLHQIWRMPLDGSQIAPFAGNAVEDIIDGPLLPRLPGVQGFAAFAQPSGLAGDGRQLYVADSEGSSIRAVPLSPGENVSTVLGTSKLSKDRLFTFGDRDGPLGRALLQHPVCVAYADRRIFVADTYNHKIKEIDLDQKAIQTIAGGTPSGSGGESAGFKEPSGLSVAGGKLYVADTNNHAIWVIDLRDSYRIATLKIDGLTPPKGL